MIEITPALMGASFLAGILTFLAPCTFPLIPAYIGFIVGDENPRWGRTLRNGFGFMLGFSLIFILFGVFTTALASVVTPVVRMWVTRLAGLLIIIWGIDMVGLTKGVRSKFGWNPRWKGLKSGTFGSSTILGSMLAVGWSPCVGPILGTILTVVWNSSNVWDGVLLMGIFSLGFAVPFLGVAALIGMGQEKIQGWAAKTIWLQRFSGVLLIGVGFLLFFDGMDAFSQWVFQQTRFINYERILDWL